MDIISLLHTGSTEMAVMNTPDNQKAISSAVEHPKRGMVLPFQPLSLAFSHVNYYVDMPSVRLSLSFSLSLIYIYIMYRIPK